MLHGNVNLAAGFVNIYSICQQLYADFIKQKQVVMISVASSIAYFRSRECLCPTCYPLTEFASDDHNYFSVSGPNWSSGPKLHSLCCFLNFLIIFVGGGGWYCLVIDMELSQI